MKIYGSGIVWDKENNKPLCKFEGGEFETKDERVIKLLQEAGYNGRSSEQGHQEGQAAEREQEKETREGDVTLEEMTYNELKTYAKAQGVAVGHKSKADLIEALR